MLKQLRSWREASCVSHPLPLAAIVAWTRHGSHRPYASSVDRRGRLKTAGLPDAHQLQKWVTSQGGKADGVRLVDLGGRDGGSGWGLTSAQDAAPGAHLIELPSACHLTYQGAADSAPCVDSRSSDPRLLALHQKIPEELWGAKLALQLLAHRVRPASSPFATYVQHLPVGVAGLPMFFPGEAIDALEYPPVVQQIKKRCRWLADFARQELAALPGTERDPFDGVAVDINALGWALGVVTSRAFRTRGPTQPAAMLPLIDMANHSFDPNCEVLPTADGVAMVVKRKVSAGEPLLLSYGKLSNDFLLLDYGFICQDNPHDRVALRFEPGLLQTGALMARVAGYNGEDMDLQSSRWKLRILDKLRLTGPSALTEVNLGGPGYVDARLLAAARTMAAAEGSELQGRSTESLGDPAKPLANKASEVAALKSLIGVAIVVLSGFKTTLEADAALLAGHVPHQEGQTEASGSSLSPAPSAAASPALSSGREGGPAGGDAGGDPSTSTSSPGQAGPLSDEMRLAVRFRMEKKRLLAKVVQELGQMVVAATAAGKAAGVNGKGGPGRGFGSAAAKSKS